MFMLAHLPVSALRCNLNFLRVHTAPHTRLSLTAGVHLHGPPALHETVCAAAAEDELAEGRGGHRAGRCGQAPSTLPGQSRGRAKATHLSQRRPVLPSALSLNSLLLSSCFVKIC